MRAAAARKAIRRRKAAPRNPKPAVAAALERIAARQDESAARSGNFVSGIDLSLRKLEEEYVPALEELSDRLDVYQRMGNDAKIMAQLRANTLPILSSARAKVVGGTQEMRDLVSQNILREGDPRFWCSTSWNQRLLEKMTALHYGFALHGKNWGVVDGYRIFSDLTYLHPKSMGGTQGPWEWSPDGARLVAVHRDFDLPIGGRKVDERIPVGLISASVWWQTGENWEGQSLIRCMYGNFIKKDLASKIGMIALMNGGVGIPMATLGPNDGPKDQTNLKTMAFDLRGGSKERQALVLANGQSMEFLTSNGQIVDCRPMIDMQNADIASGGATDFMQAGQTASGSRAGGSVMMVAYMQQINATLKWLQETINHGAGYLRGEVEDLIYANFQNVKECPQIDLSQVSPADQIDNLTLLGDLTQKGVVRPNLKTANAALDRLGHEPLTQAEWDAAEPNAKDNGGAGRPDNATPVDRNEPRNDKAGRAFGLADTPAEKKSPNGPLVTAWTWLESSAP